MVTTFVGFGRPDQGSGGPLRILAMRRFARCDRGVSAVEFALILPLLMLFLFSIIAFGSTFYVHVNMENAAREAVRRMAVAEASGFGTPVSCATAQADPAIYEAESYACDYLVNWPVSFEVTADMVGTCPGDRDVVVTVTVPAEEVALADVFGFFAGRTLTAEVFMRPEDVCPVV